MTGLIEATYYIGVHRPKPRLARGWVDGLLLWRHLVAAISLLLVFGLSGYASAKPVGFQPVLIPNGNEPPLRGAIWYPTRGAPRDQPLESFVQRVAPDGSVDGRRLPLVVISHGGGGSLAGHYDTALALAAAGLVVAAVDHAGDTYDDQSQVLKLWRRPQQLSRLITFVLRDWRDHDRVDPGRVGAFGFSNGGFTVLVSAGGKPDLALIDPYCRENPSHDLCVALRKAGVGPIAALPTPADAWKKDTRIRAVAAAAPAFGYTFTHDGLANVSIPIQLWRGSEDRHQPNPWYEEWIRKSLPVAPNLRLVKGAGHYDFLAPCSPTLARAAPLICSELNGFDRVAFHRELNAELIRFFRETLSVRTS